MKSNQMNPDRLTDVVNQRLQPRNNPIDDEDLSTKFTLGTDIIILGEDFINMNCKFRYTHLLENLNLNYNTYRSILPILLFKFIIVQRY